MFNFNLKGSNIHDCKIVELPRIQAESGSITSLNSGSEISFNIQRVYYLYDIPGGAERGGHAHKELYQLIVAATGSFDVVINDGKLKQTITLNRPYYGLQIVPGIWRELRNFSSGSMCLVIASQEYNEEDYVRDFEEFIQIKK